MDQLLKVDEISKILGLKKAGILNRIRKNSFEIPAVKMGNGQIRIKKSDLEQYLSELKEIRRAEI